MSQRILRIDDRTGEQSADANPPGWLNVNVRPVGTDEVIEADFESWQNFREWVELSDPGCGKVLDPSKQ